MASFALNYQDLWEIDITPTGSTATWARLGAGLSSADPSNNEELDQTGYLDGNGNKSTTVTGGQLTFAFSGHRDISDAAQNFIAAIGREYGSARTTSLRLTEADGTITYVTHRSGGQGCTVCNIDFGGGDPGAKKEIAFEIHINGAPTFTDPAAATALTATVAAGSASGTTKFTATATSGNSLAYKLTAASLGTVYGGSYPSGLKAYTSAADIKASVGQYLNMYELDPYGHVYKYATHTLVSADITT